MTTKLLGIAEIGALVDVKPQTVAQWYKRGKLPKPYERLACGPVWERSVIETWWGPDPAPAKKAPPPDVPVPARRPNFVSSQPSGGEVPTTREVVTRFKG